MTMLPSQMRPATDLPTILQAVCDYFNVDPADVMGRSRSTSAQNPRLVFCYLARKHTAASFPDIGGFLHRDHSTIQSAVRKVKREVHGTPSGPIAKAVGRVNDILNGSHVNTRRMMYATIERWRNSLSQVAQSGMSDHDVARLVDWLSE